MALSRTFLPLHWRKIGCYSSGIALRGTTRQICLQQLGVFSFIEEGDIGSTLLDLLMPRVIPHRQQPSS